MADRPPVSILLPTTRWTDAYTELAAQLEDHDELLIIHDVEDDPVTERQHTPGGVRLIATGEPEHCSGKANAIATGMETARHDRLVWTDDDFHHPVSSAELLSSFTMISRIMRAATYHGQEEIRIEEIETTTVGPTEVRIAIDSCGICGSDLHEYAAGPIFIPAEEPHPVSNESAPITMGHEFSGTVTEIGEAVTDLEEGDQVAVNPILYCGDCRQCIEGNYHLCDIGGFIGLSGGGGGFAESIVVDAEKAVPLAEGVSLEAGALVEPLAVGLHAVRRSGLQAGDSVAVFGSGPIGLSVIQCAKAAGAGQLFVSEPRAARRSRADACGADDLIDPMETDAVEHISSETGGGVDIAFEVAGIETTFNDAIGSTRPSGTVTIVSIWEEEVRTHPNELVLGERTLSGTLAYLGGPRSGKEYGMVIDMLADGRLDPEPLITDRIQLEDIVENGFERLLDADSDQVKIMVQP